MKKICHLLISSLFASGSALAADLPPAWRHAQSFQVTAPGLVKISLPMETLDAARSGLEDLRLFDDGGREIPFFLHRSLPAEKKVSEVASFQVQLAQGSTSITMASGTRQPIEGISLVTPAANFIKAVSAENSENGAVWHRLAQGLPIFRQSSGPSQLTLRFPLGIRPFIRLTVDDQLSPPIPFSGAKVHQGAIEVPAEPLAVSVSEQSESAGQTRLALNLGAAHLRLADIQLETPEPLFTRQVIVAARQVEETEIRETPLATGTIYRLSAEGQLVSANLTVPVEAQIPTRELILLVQHQDSPPLKFTGFKARRRPVYLVFHVPVIGKYHLLSGNRRCPAPNYDLAALGADLQTVEPFSVIFTPLSENPSFKPAEPLPVLEVAGAPLDLAPWKFRKPVIVSGSGIQQLELDLETISSAETGLQDLRLMENSLQVPYLLERTALARPFNPHVTLANDPRKPKISRWKIKLPHPRLPVQRILVSAASRMFKRDVLLAEETPGRREGGARFLARGSWEQTPEQPKRNLLLRLAQPPGGDTLYLETDNGDNPALEIDKVECFYLASRLYFKAAPPGNLFLYYGNSRTAPPRYDLNLVAHQILSSEKAAAALGPQETLKQDWLRATGASSPTSWMLWGVLGLVVVILVLVISKMLK